MEYCRELKFEQEPNYRKVIGMFESCAANHSFEMNIKDFMWKQNRLSKDKEALKAQMMGVLKKGANKEAGTT